MFSGLNEDDIQLLSKQYNSKFITYETSPGYYTFNDLEEILSRGFRNDFDIGKLRLKYNHDNYSSIIIDSDTVTLITKLVFRYEIYASRFDEDSFFASVWGFSRYWDYESW